MSKKNSKKFEQSLSRLEEIANLLENDEVGLEDAMQLYEEGINISRECITSLKNAELKITELKKKVEDILVEEKDLFDER